MKKLSLLLILSLLISSCGHLPFDPDKHTVADGNFMGRRFTQDGKTTKIHSVMDQLQRFEETKEDAKAGQTLFYVGGAFGGAGGFLLGYYGFKDLNPGESRTTGLIVGAGLVVTSFFFSYYADQKLLRAVEKNNERIGVKKTEKKSAKYWDEFIPYVSLSKDQEGYFPTIGLSSTF